MSALLAPLLAQLVTIGIADRTEARYLTSSDYHYDGATRPSVRLQLATPHYNLSLGYGAGFTLAPLESTPRDLTVYHSASVTNSYQLRHTSFTLGASASFGEINFLTQALNAPATTPTPASTAPATPNNETPTDGGAGTQKPDPGKLVGPAITPGVAPAGQPQQQHIDSTPVRYGTWSTFVGVTQQVDRALRLSANASYSVAGSLDQAERANYPLTRGTNVGVSAGYLWLYSGRDSFITTVSLQQAWASISNQVTGNQVTSLFGNEAWGHRFDPYTTSTLSLGLSTTRVPFGQYSAYTVYPTFGAFLTHSERVARGTLTLGVGGYSAPSLDPLRATVDPRLGASGSVGWSRDRFSARLGGGASVSIADSGNNAGAFNNKSASAGTAYRLTDWMQVDAGGSLAEQAYQGRTTLQLSYAAFVGLTFGVAAPITGRKH
jgi:hypothetical protein